jgi:FeS assembly SUF system protein
MDGKMDGKPIETETAPVANADSPEAATPVAAPPAAAAGGPVVGDDPLLNDIIAALKTVYDPEIPSDIYELGLIYAVDVDDDKNVAISMTLTAPGCPVAGEMPKWVENAVNAVPGVNNTTVTMTFDPPWDMSRMSDEARLALNMF